MHPACLSEVSVVFSEFLQAFRSLISHFWAAAAAEDGGGRVSNQMTERSRQPSAASGCKPSGSKAGQGARGSPRVPPSGTPSRLSARPLRALLPIADGAYRPLRGRGVAAGCAWCGGAVDTRRLGVRGVLDGWAGLPAESGAKGNVEGAARPHLSCCPHICPVDAAAGPAAEPAAHASCRVLSGPAAGHAPSVHPSAVPERAGRLHPACGRHGAAAWHWAAAPPPRAWCACGAPLV